MLPSRRKILVIDADDMRRETISSGLRCVGYQPIEASTGREGIHLALRSPPHLILCDLMMSGIDGFGVLGHLRAEPKTASVPLIFMASGPDAGDARLSLLLETDDFVVKPIAGEILMNVIEKRLGNSFHAQAI